MRSHVFGAVLTLGIIFWGGLVVASPGPAGEDAYLGRWDITATGSPSGLPRNCWLEIKRENGALKGRFNQGGGAVFDLPMVTVEHGGLKFQYPQWKTRAPQVWQGVMKGKSLAGTARVDGETLSWTGVRAPVWPATPPLRTPGKPVDLFNGNDTSNWLCQDPRRAMGWFVKDGILMNEGKDANNIYSRQRFNDFKLAVEFNVDPQSNSGVYLRGRYEIQILDDVNRPLDVHSQGALYGFIVPPVKASKPAGEWQTYDITLVANRVTVILNGTKLFENAEVPGITGGALDANEKEPGPILLQGDHGRVQFRKVRITPLI